METIIKEEGQTDIKNFVNIKSFTLSPKVKEGGAEIKALRRYIKTGDISLIQPYIDSGSIIDKSEQHNLITDAALEQYAMSQSGERSTSPAINYGLLGTGTPNPVAGQTQLVNEVYRKQASSRSHSKNISYIDFFFAAADWNGTATEFGNVIDGTSVANTGILHSTIATGGWVKTSSQSLFVSCEYHNNNA